MHQLRFVPREDQGPIDRAALGELRAAIATHLGMNQQNVFGNEDPAGPFDRLRIDGQKLHVLRDPAGNSEEVLDTIEPIDWLRIFSRFRDRIDVLLITPGFGEVVEGEQAQAEA